MDEKSEAFKRLATARVNKALNDIRLVGNLSNRSNYEFTRDDVDAVFEALRVAIRDCRKRFDLALDPVDKGFRLD